MRAAPGGGRCMIRRPAIEHATGAAARRQLARRADRGDRQAAHAGLGYVRGRGRVCGAAAARPALGDRRAGPGAVQRFVRGAGRVEHLLPRRIGLPEPGGGARRSRVSAGHRSYGGGCAAAHASVDEPAPDRRVAGPATGRGLGRGHLCERSDVFRAGNRARRPRRSHPVDRLDQHGRGGLGHDARAAASSRSSHAPTK